MHQSEGKVSEKAVPCGESGGYGVGVGGGGGAAAFQCTPFLDCEFF